MPHAGCFNHKFNLVMKSMIEKSKPTLAEMNDIVSEPSKNTFFYQNILERKAKTVRLIIDPIFLSSFFSSLAP